jgi:hypothetical protein
VHIGQHVPELILRQHGFKGRHHRLHGFERLDLTALAHSPEEIRIAVTGCPVKVMGEVGRGMRQAHGSWALPLPVGAVADHAVGLEERLPAGGRRRIAPARAPGLCIRSGGFFPRVVLVGMSLVCVLARSLVGETVVPQQEPRHEQDQP